MVALWGLATGLVGIVLAAALSWGIAGRERRITTTFDLHKEFNGNEMAVVRYTASKLLSAHLGKTYLDIRGEVGNLAMREVWTVTHFYQRLWLAIKYRAVHPKLVPELFGDLFDWWYEGTFRHQLVPLGTEPAIHIEQLKLWLDRNSTEEQRRLWRDGNRNFPIETADGAGQAKPTLDLA